MDFHPELFLPGISKVFRLINTVPRLESLNTTTYKVTIQYIVTDRSWTEDDDHLTVENKILPFPTSKSNLKFFKFPPVKGVNKKKKKILRDD